MPHPISKHECESVSPDAERDGIKVTMQTRVAVRDKIPHRFQVIPLREIMKPPSPSEHSAGTRLFKKSHSARSSKLAENGFGEFNNEKKIRSLGRASGKVILRKKDTNREEPDLKHKPVSLLAPVPDLIQGRAKRTQESLPPKTFAPAHGYSQSLNQYSFHLKPRKSYPSMKISDVRLGDSLGMGSVNTDVSSCSSEHLGSVSDRTLSERSCDAFLLKLPPSDYPSSSFSTTLNDFDGQLNLNPAYSKRHAIYSHMDIIPLGSTPGVLPFKDTLGREDTSHSGLETRGHDLVPYPTALLPPVRPLKVIRSSVIRPSTDTILYSTIILDLMRELDDAIESWSSGF